MAKEKYSLTVEVVTFTDYVTPNVALNDGSVDVNAFQHKPYLDAQIRDRGFKLVPVGLYTFVYPIAGYPEGQGPVRAERRGCPDRGAERSDQPGSFLILLEKQGLLKLKRVPVWKRPYWTSPATRATSKIVELEAAQLPRSLEDVDLAIINNTFAGQIGLTPTENGPFVEDKSPLRQP